MEGESNITPLARPGPKLSGGRYTAKEAEPRGLPSRAYRSLIPTRWCHERADTVKVGMAGDH